MTRKRRRPSRAEQAERDALAESARRIVGLLHHPPWRITEILLEARDCTVDKPEARAWLVAMGQTLTTLGREIETELGPQTRL
jgi:hypothetical protein